MDLFRSIISDLRETPDGLEFVFFQITSIEVL